MTDRATGAPVAGVTIAAYDLSGTRITSVRSAAGGTYRHDALPVAVIAGGSAPAITFRLSPAPVPRRKRAARH